MNLYAHADETTNRITMEYLFSILDKILFIIILMALGVLVKRLGWVSDQGEKDLSVLMVDFIWPCMIFSSVVTSLTAADITANIWLPILSVVIHLTGYALGLIACRIFGYQGDERSMLLLHAAMNNFFVMALPFAQYFYPGKGAALLAVANLGSILSLWTLGVFIVAGNVGFKQTVKNILCPGMVATVAAILCVFSGINRFIPQLILDVLHLCGQPTMLLGLLIAGTQIYKLGRKALKFNRWNILVGLIRNILVPGLMLCLALLLKGRLTREALTIFMLISMTPASVNSVTLALKYDSSPNLAAEGVIFTHLLAVASMLGFVVLVEMFVM